MQTLGRQFSEISQNLTYFLKSLDLFFNLSNLILYIFRSHFIILRVTEALEVLSFLENIFLTLRYFFYKFVRLINLTFIFSYRFRGNYILRFGKVGSKINDFVSFFYLFFLTLALQTGEMYFVTKKNFLQVLRNMLDTLLKFGGIWLSSFRDLGFTKLKIFENPYGNSLRKPNFSIL